MKQLSANSELPSRQHWNQQSIVALLRHSDAAVQVALLRIYSRQTPDEQATSSTAHCNGVGFSACDSPILSKLAKKLTAGKQLQPAELVAARERIVHYHRQLLEIVAEKSLQQLRSR